MDRLPGAFTSSIVGLSGAGIDDAVDGLLRLVAEALGAGHAGLECASDDPAHVGAARAWTSAVARSADAGFLTLPVMIAGRRVGRLSVGGCDGEWPAVVAERLRLLAGLMILAMQHGSQLGSDDRVTPNMAPVPRARAAAGHASGLDTIVGDSPLLQVAIARVDEVARTAASVMLLGETGTGKELFARAIHDRSGRSGPFICVNCAALPASLIESELFGHERGAFTGAVSMRQGRFELAHRGTLFLDEIGDLPPEVQVKLLRVLQEGEFERVGSSRSRPADVRVVAATHHDLDAAIRQGRFRADLYYRLNVYPIELPPLRERVEDIPQLAWFFVRRGQAALGRTFASIPGSVLAALQHHSWPGNVRELENVIARAMIHSTGGTLLLDDEQTVSMAAPSASSTLETVERRHIEDALRRSQWRINGTGNAAETLGLHPNTLRFRMKKLGISRPGSRGTVRPFRRHG